jgi:hypothetical protein
MPRREIARALARKGFVLDERDHAYFRLWVDGLDTGIYTKLSRGAKYRDIDRSLLGEIADQLHLSNEDFEQLVDCKIDGPAYVALLRTKGLQL